MWQEIFRIPFINMPVYGYGLMMVIGFLVGIEVAKKLAKQKGLDPEVFVNAALIALVTGVAGARISHVLENLGDYTRADRSVWENFVDAINIRSGGLTFYGGFLLAFPTLVLYAIKKKIPVKVGMDIIAPCLMVGLGFGRIGCFMNGCCYGANCSLPWAVRFPYDSNAYVEQSDRHQLIPPPALRMETASGNFRPLTKSEITQIEDIRYRLAHQDEASVRLELAKSGGQYRNPAYLDAMVDHARESASVDFASLTKSEKALPVHPAQLYSSFTAFLLVFLLLAYFTMPHAPGRVFALMLMLEGSSRFILEMVRVEPAVFGTSFSLSMWLGMLLAGLGLLLWVVFGASEHQGAPAAAGAVVG